MLIKKLIIFFNFKVLRVYHFISVKKQNGKSISGISNTFHNFLLNFPNHKVYFAYMGAYSNYEKII